MVVVMVIALWTVTTVAFSIIARHGYRQLIEQRQTMNLLKSQIQRTMTIFGFYLIAPYI